MEYYSAVPNISTQIQGLPGRMTGYWKDIIAGGHKTGPFRTSLEAVVNYEKWIKNPTERASKFNNEQHLTHHELHGIESKVVVEEVKKISKELILSRSRIPVCIENLNKNDIIFDKKTKKNDKIDYIKNKLKQDNKNFKLLEFIVFLSTENKDGGCIQITIPESDNSYKKHITNIYNKVKQNKKCSIDLDAINKEKNNWQCFVDSKLYRLIIIPYCVDTYRYP